MDCLFKFTYKHVGVIYGALLLFYNTSVTDVEIADGNLGIRKQ